jgi:threonine synthase
MSKDATKPKKGLTPTEAYPALAEAISGGANTFSDLYFKREDMHPYGSHKGRSIPHMIDKYLASGSRHFVISSSGNAALAAGLYVNELNAKRTEETLITLEILAGKNIRKDKLEKLQSLRNEHVLVSMHERPLQVLFIKTKEAGAVGLRQSTDDTALEGYENLAEELSQIPDLAAIFIGTSSGTTAQALADYFIKNQSASKNKKSVEINIVQTPTCHPLVTTQDETSEKSIADAIVDQIAHRKQVLLPLIEKTGGTGWITTNESLRIAQDLSKKHAGVDISTNSALSVAGLMNAIYTGKKWPGSVVCMICGD